MNKENCDLVIDFQAGDLLFGLEKEAREHCYNDVFTQLVKSGAKYQFITIDEINGRLAPLFFEKQYSMSPLRECPTPVRNHGAFLLAQEAFHPRTPEDLHGSEKKLRYKQLRSCLAAIRNCTGKIRFCLDGLDLQKLRNKECDKEYNSYTSNELRHIAYNYADYSEKVVFYFQGMQVDAPWVQEGQSPEEWLENYMCCQPEPVPENAFVYDTPPQKTNAKRSRAELIKEKFLDSSSQDAQYQTKCPKWDDEDSDFRCLP